MAIVAERLRAYLGGSRRDVPHNFIITFHFEMTRTVSIVGSGSGLVGQGVRLGIVLLLLLSGQLSEAWAQEAASPQYVRTQWTAMEEGLPSNGIQAVLQNDDGYIWMGTEGGLARFDGVAFEETRITRVEAKTRLNDRILEVQEYEGGLLVLYRTRDFVHYQTEGATLVADSVWAHQVGGEGRVWIGADDGVSVYRNGMLKRVAPEQMDAAVRGLLRTSDGTLWVGTKDQGVYRRTPDGAVTHVTTEDGLLSNRVGAFAEDDGAILIGTAAGLQRWENGRLTEISPPEALQAPLEVVKIRGDVHGTCWVRATQGVYRCREGRLTPYLGATSDYQRRPKYISKDFGQEGPEGRLLVNTGRTVY